VSRLEIVGITGLPEVEPETDLAALILDGLRSNGLTLASSDVLVVTQKIVSKAEGCEVALDGVTPSPLARQWAAQHDKDARLIELTLREAARIVRMEKGVLITETRHGLVCANSGVDASNTRPGYALTLPVDPDASARRIGNAVYDGTGVRVGVIISDTFGRPWREGLVNVAIGISGVRAFEDYRGRVDSFGRPLTVSVLAVADEIASAAELVMGKSSQIPVALIRGGTFDGAGTARGIIRRPETDLFR
jgi:coenzyme F420-0:L-glutamate ligase/coenzyme F420-1:gamma-L-glutamate ligase